MMGASFQQQQKKQQHLVSSLKWLDIILLLLLYLTSIVTGNILFEARENSLCSYTVDTDDLTGVVSKTGAGSCFLQDLSFTVGIDADVRDRTLFFSDINEGTLRKVSIADGTQAVKQVFHALGQVEDIAVDWLSRNLYWTDFALGHVSASRYDGSRRVVLITEQNGPRSIVLWPARGIMFWTNVGDTLTAGNIMRADLSGGNDRVLVSSGLSSPNGLALDFSNSRLYFADRGTEMIESVNLGGGQRKQLYQADMADFFDMTIFGGYLFTTRWSGSDPTGYITAVQYPLDGDQTDFVAEVIEFDSHNSRGFGITTFDDSRQAISTNKPNGLCEEDNGGCAHLCMPIANNDYVCQCATGYTLDADGSTCNTDEVTKDFLLFADSSISTIFQGYLDPEESGETENEYVVTAVDLEGASYPVDLAFDPVEGMVYWTDRTSMSVNRAGINGTSDYQMVAGLNVEDPSGLDLDVLRRLVYWVDEDLKTINVINMDLTGQRVILDTGLDQPRAIAVDPLASEIFWTDWGQTAKIEKAKTNGLGRQVIVAANLGWPNGLTIDVQGKELYWCDAQNDIIEKSDLNGNSRRVVAYLDEGAHPFGIAISTTLIYWSDWTTRNVYTMSREGQNPQALTDEGMFLRLQGMCVSSVSYPLDALPTTTSPVIITTPDTGSQGGSDPLSSDSVTLIAAAVGGGLGFLAIIFISTLIVCKCNRKGSDDSRNRAPENLALQNLHNLNHPPPALPGKNIDLPPESKLRPQAPGGGGGGGDHLYEDLDNYAKPKLSYDDDVYLNPVFEKDEQAYSGGGEYTGLNMNAGNGYLDMTAMRLSSSPPDSVYMDPQPPSPYSGRSDTYTDLRTDSQQPGLPRASQASMSGLMYPPQYQSNKGAPRPPPSPRPSQTSAPRPPTSPRPSQTSAPRISATRPSPSPRISATRPPPSPRMSTTVQPPLSPGSFDTYMDTFGMPPQPPGNGSLYEVTMN